MSKKSADKSAGEIPPLVPQPHGGAILSGGKPGNTPGSGRPPSAIRARLRRGVAANLGVIEGILKNPNAKDADRIRAWDAMAKYGLGPQSGVTAEQVRDKLGETLAIIREEAGEEVALRILNRMRSVWR